MANKVLIEHATFGLLGPIVHTQTHTMPIHCVIFQLGDRVILLDSGFGTPEMLEPNRLLGDDVLWRLAPLIDLRLTAVERLEARGIDPEQVTDIILTHLDNDHAGGLHDFPNATVHISREELEGFDGTQPRGPYKPYQISHYTKFQTYDLYFSAGRAPGESLIPSAAISPVDDEGLVTVQPGFVPKHSQV